jgi:ATP-dependent DNA helicase RecQ
MVDITQHGGIKITHQGIKFLKEKGAIKLRQYVARKKAVSTPKLKSAITIESPNDQNLFYLLKAKRLELAKAQNIPPYVIFHDKTLRELAIIKPTSTEDMSKISGIGGVKLKKYGKMFLEVIVGS